MACNSGEEEKSSIKSLHSPSTSQQEARKVGHPRSSTWRHNNLEKSRDKIVHKASYLHKGIPVESPPDDTGPVSNKFGAYSRAKKLKFSNQHHIKKQNKTQKLYWDDYMHGSVVCVI